MVKKLSQLIGIFIALLFILGSLAQPYPVFALDILIGTTNNGASFGGTAETGHWTKFTATQTGTVSEIRVEVEGATNVKVAIYADNGGTPTGGARLGYNNNVNACVDGWNTIALTVSASVTNGVSYWLAMSPDATNAARYTSGAETYRYAAGIYAGGFADPCPATSAGGVYYWSIAGWGTIAVVPTVSTQAATSVEATTASCSGNVTAINDTSITARTIVYDTVTHASASGEPPAGYSDNVNEYGTWGTGVFTLNLTGLTTGTLYYYRAGARNNLGDWGYGNELTFLTKPAAPTNVAATDGTQTTKVVVTWTKPTGATNYRVYRDGVDVSGLLGDVATYDDTGAGAPTITPGTATASDGTSTVHVVLSVAGESAANGTTHTYKVVASNATGNSADSATDTGYRGTTTLGYQWQRSAADADAGFASIVGEGGTTDPYNDINAPANGDGRWYYCIITMTGATNQDTTHDRGYRAVAPTVVTGLCTGFGTTWAVVNGTITNIGLPATGVTQIGFDYGTTTGYGSSALFPVGTYIVGTNYSIALTNLNPATLYHYRFKATNAVGWGYGSDAVFATEGSAVLYEYLSSGSDNCTVDTYSANWGYQTFTTSQAHTVSSVRLYIQRTGNPGTVTTSIKRTTGGIPTGTDLGAATYNGNNFATSPSWYEFAFSPEIRLESSTQYAVVVRAIDGSAANKVEWCMVNAGGLANGNAGYSTDSGSSWVSLAPADHLLEIWGYPCLGIEDAKVFTNYQTTGDWLVVMRYTNVYPPYYDSYNVKSYFVLQLTDASGTVKAQVACPEWDYKPGSIYLSPSLTTALTYGGAYRVRLYGTFTGNPYVEYPLQSTDWLGSDLTRLDNWVITSAKLLGTYYSQVLTTYIAERGEVLNSTGGVFFANGVTALSTVRPNLFQIISTPVTPPTGDFPQAGEGAATWQALLGPYVSAKLTGMGDVFGVDGKAFGAWILIGTMVCLMVFGLPTGHAAPANILATPIFLMGLGLRLFDWATGAIMLCLMAFLLFYQLYFKYG